MLPLPVPASVYGLVLLLAALTAGIVKLEQVKAVSYTHLAESVRIRIIIIPPVYR